MRLSMLISEAMIEGMKNRGINIERINYQDNGNWAYLKGTNFEGRGVKKAIFSIIIKFL